MYSAKRDSTRGIRDLAIVALHCFSGLRPEEITALDWDQIEVARQGEGYQALCVAVHRGGQAWTLPLPRHSATALVQLADSLDAQIGDLHGPIFKRSASVDQPLSYRAIRDVVGRACDQSGLPIVEAVDLRAAFAHWLGSQGLSDHEVASVLGVQRVRTVDRLLRRHRALDAQRRVRETQSR
ncbi:MAG: site-specific integrase [Chloroflexia bacterium]|nr:site-specific integrase [Chloroflexia bacterium]